MNIRKLLLGLAMVALPTVALLPTTPAVADEADDEATEVDEEASAEAEVEDLDDAESGCADVMKECKTKFSLDKAFGGARSACKELRGCKKSCRADKKGAKKEAKKAAKSCAVECNSKKGKDRRACKQECRIAKKEDIKEARAARKGCVTECRAKHLTPECKTARAGFLKAGADCVKSIAANKDCQQQTKNIFDSIAQAFEGG